jgi:hypothetical protein
MTTMPFQPRQKVADPRGETVSFRASDGEIRQLDRLTTALGFPARADTIREALAYWMTHAKEAKGAMKAIEAEGSPDPPS